MKIKIRKKILLSSLISSLIVAPTMVLGAIPAVPTSLPQTGVYNIIMGIAKIIYWAVIIFSIVVILLGAVQFLTAGGDSDKVKSARDRIMYAVVAIVVATAAYGIVDLVITNI